MDTDIRPGQRVRIEGVVTHVEPHYVEIRLETGGFLRVFRPLARPVPDAPAPAEEKPDER